MLCLGFQPNSGNYYNHVLFRGNWMRVSIDRGDNQSIPNWVGQCSGSSSERNVYSGTALVLK